LCPSSEGEILAYGLAQSHTLGIPRSYPCSKNGCKGFFADVLAKWSNGTQEIEKKLGKNVIENLPPNTC
jgi:hypothetical protein